MHKHISILGQQPNKKNPNLDGGSIERVLYTSTQSLQPPRTFQHCSLRPLPESIGVVRAVRELEEEIKQKVSIKHFGSH